MKAEYIRAAVCSLIPADAVLLMVVVMV